MALQMTWHPQHQRRRKSGPPLGLKNLGNSCYLNSVLQCLTYTPPLAHFCLSSLHSSHCKSNLVECSFCILERQIARSLSVEGPTVDTPAKIHNRIALFAENFRWGRQEDAHEFLRYVIDACHNTCLKLLKKDKEKEKSPLPSNSTTVMRDIFGGALLSQVKCLSCEGESNKTDEIMDISLDLMHSNSLNDALDHFFLPEILDGNNKYNCSKCKKLSVAKKQMFIKRAPNVLVIQLKRFEGIYGGKINRNIEFEEVLVLSKFMCSTSQDLQPEYNLFGSIVHSGYSPESGHYYAYIKDPSGRWYYCNDAHVSLSSAQEVLSEKVYILFYIRNNRDPISSKTGSPCNGKSSDSNGNELSSCQKSELLRRPIVKPNGMLSSKSNVSSVLKNGKVSSNPQIKAIDIKKLEIKKVIANGNDNIVVHNNGGVGNNGYNKLYPSVKESMALPENVSGDNGAVVNNGYNKLSPSGKRSTTFSENGSGNNAGVRNNGYTKLSPGGKKRATLPENSFREESKVFHKIKVSPISVSNIAGGNSSLENGRKKLSQVPNGNNCSNPQKKELHENATQDGEVVRQHHCNNSSNNVINETYGTTLVSKRKSCEAKIPGSSKFCTQVRTPEDLENFKEEIAAEASFSLRSCGWCDSVYDFMLTRKRRCAQVTGSCPDETELRKQLITDARKNFLSKIPESLKESLIERLKSFSETNDLLVPKLLDHRCQPLT